MPVITQEMVDHINAQGKWKASMDFAKDMTVGQARRLTGALKSETHLPEGRLGALEQYISVPDTFDARNNWPDCIGAIRNQGDCGSCWAFSATEVLADRICIESNGNTKVVLSPQELVSCDTTDYGCGGGYLPNAWAFMSSNGVPTDTAYPYSTGSMDDDESGTCTAASGTFYKATNTNEFTTVAQIQAEILANGPVQTSFTVYQDFYSYTSGIYTYQTGDEVGLHAVKIVGWGDGYWIVANSWGASWAGLNGFFWIAFGQCGIDSTAYAGVWAH